MSSKCIQGNKALNGLKYISVCQYAYNAFSTGGSIILLQQPFYYDCYYYCYYYSTFLPAWTMSTGTEIDETALSKQGTDSCATCQQAMTQPFCNPKCLQP